jgi:hypothetical protein
LFCWHAFGGEKPPDSLAELAEKAAARCGGLPLALRVLGRQVLGAEEGGNKEDVLRTFVDLPQASGAMDACRAIIVKSYKNLPPMHSNLRDVFILVAGVWPWTPEFMQRQRAVENLGAVYGGEPRSIRFRLVEKALDKLNSLSLVGLKEDGNAGGLSLTVHDLIVNVAKNFAESKEQGCKKFFRQPADPEGLRLPDDARGLKHLSIHLGSLRIGKIPAACSLVLGPGVIKLVESSRSPCKLLDIEGLQSIRLHNLAQPPVHAHASRFV